MGGHAGEMGAAAAWGAGLDEPKSVERAPSVRLEEIYDACFDFVWRSARRMGVAEAHADDVVQEVFLVAHRRLADFEGRSSVRTWLFGILLRVVSDHRRTLRRKGGLSPLPDTLLPESLRAPSEHGPAERIEQRQRVELLHRLLSTLDEERRAVFILAELEQMSAPEIADALDLKLNTVYSRLRVARQKFDEALARHRAREDRP